jgi:hypothetical protein
MGAGAELRRYDMPVADLPLIAPLIELYRFPESRGPSASIRVHGHGRARRHPGRPGTSGRLPTCRFSGESSRPVPLTIALVGIGAIDPRR